ncbi:MAG: tetratricopeptide repeat protein [Sedimentisphaerales bacterium]|nr:tetratricopeptide repeat protein [Sedimentisphaerales bacterium]
MVICKTMLLAILLASSPRSLIRSGNSLYGQGKFDQALTEYDKALAADPGLYAAMFNKANAYYRLEDLAKAAELYQQVATGSKDMDLVKKAKYNLGNTHFQKGLRERDSNLSKALEELKTSIALWRAVLDIDPNYEPAKKNKQVASLIIKDILDQLKKDRPKDPNQPGQGQDDKQQQQQQEGGQGQQQQWPSQISEPNQPEQADQPGQDPNDIRTPTKDLTAEQIIEREQKQRQQRQMNLRGTYLPVERDW